MKISVDDKEVFVLSETQKNVLKNEIPSAKLDEDLKRRLHWVLDHKYQRAFVKMKKEWDKKLELNGVESIPVDKDAYAQLVFSQPNYKDRDARDKDDPTLVVSK